MIPGIIASYRYSMAAYIMAEHPDMTLSEAAQAAFYREISAPVYEEIPSDPTLYSYEML